MVEAPRVISELDLAGMALAHMRIHLALNTPSDRRMARILAMELHTHATQILKDLGGKPQKTQKQKTKK